MNAAASYQAQPDYYAVLQVHSSADAEVIETAYRLALLSGALTPVLTQANVPVWVAWAAFGLLGLLLAARLYVFSVLPMLGACWLVAAVT